MNWEAIKQIYISVLKYGCKIQYHGNDCYTLTHYHDNGNKCWENEYRNDQLHGKFIRWWENGNKWWEVEYRNGELHGKSIWWDENGNINCKAEYCNGKRIN